MRFSNIAFRSSNLCRKASGSKSSQVPLYLLLIVSSFLVIGCDQSTVNYVRSDIAESKLLSDKLVLRTAGGELFSLDNEGVKKKLTDLSIAAFGVSSAGELFYLDNQGSLWSQDENTTPVKLTGQFRDSVMAGVRDLRFADGQDVGWTLFLDGLWRSADGGANWSQRFRVREHTSEQLTRLEVFNKEIVLVGGTKGKLFISHDQGSRWDDISVPTSGDVHVIRALSETHFLIGIIGNDDYSLFQTLDSGENWQPVRLPRSNGKKPGVHSIYAQDSNYWYVLAGESIKEGNRIHRTVSIFTTADQGSSWEQVNIPQQSFETLQHVRDKEFYLIARNSVWHTNDGGSVWTVLYQSE